MTAAVRALACPACGGALSIGSGEMRAACGSCGTPGAVVDPGARLRAGPRLRIVPRVSPASATATVRFAIAEWPVDERVPDEAVIRPPELVYVPFWEVASLQSTIRLRKVSTALVRGGRVDFSTGTRRFLDDAGREIAEADYYRRRERTVADAQIVLRDMRAVRLAGGPADWNLAVVNLNELLDDPETRLLPLDPAELAGTASVLTPRLSPSHVLAEAAEPLRSGEQPVRDIAVRSRLIHVPVWVVRWSIGRHAYTFVVSGVDGKILHGRAPETRRRGRLYAFAAAVVIGFPLGCLVHFIAHGDRGGVGFSMLIRTAISAWEVPAGALVLMLSFLAVVWSEFRFRGEVEFGPWGARTKRHAKPPRTAIERLANEAGAAFARLAERSHRRRM